MMIEGSPQQHAATTSAASGENPYQKILAVLGTAMFWICLSSLLHERSSSDVNLPLDPFKDGKSRGSVIIFGILVCWPMFTIVNLVGWRLAVTSAALPWWNRLPQPFGLGTNMLPTDRKVYALIFALAFYLVPYVHVGQFACRFFLLEKSEPIWLWTRRAWFEGIHHYYLDAFYYGWVPILAILFALVTVISTIGLVRAIRAPLTQKLASAVDQQTTVPNN